MKEAHLKGEVDYDAEHDLLLFKASEREYDRSVELDSVVIDIDKEGLITGIEIFDASQLLNLKKEELAKVRTWIFKTSVHEGRINIQLRFQVIANNKIIEKNPIIMQTVSEPLPDSELQCEAG